MWKIKFMAHATMLGLEEWYAEEFENELPDRKKSTFDLSTTEGQNHAAAMKKNCCLRYNLMQFDGKADLGFGRGRTQNNEGCRGHTFLCISLARRKYEGPGGFGEEARPHRIQEILFPFFFSRQEKSAKKCEGNSRFPASRHSPQATKEVGN